ncbi:MAG: ABC transporter ATP-binding protein [Rhodospirillaceae bacterium BRH_c57]|nr:MAG: ABC transporter ATP-binding protein [Rhodospirillaceae bacterium BRH_c57]
MTRPEAIVAGRRRLPELIAASLFLNVVGLALPLAMLQVYDRILPNQSLATLDALVIGVGVAILLEMLLRQLREGMAAYVSARFEHRGHIESLKRLLSIPMSAYEKEGSGSHLERLAAIDKLRDQFGGRTLLAFVDLPFVVLFLTVILLLGGWLVAVPVGIAVIFVVLSILQARFLRKATEETGIQDERRYNFMLETLAGVHTIKALAAESQMLRRFERLLDNAIDGRQGVALRNGSVQMLGGLFGQVTTVLTVAFGAMLVVDEAMTVGSLAACTMLAGRVAPPIQAAVNAWLRRQTLSTARARLQETFSVPVKTQVDRGNVGGLRRTHRGRLDLVGVGHGRRDGRMLIEDVTLTVEPGQSISIRGDNGCGKSLLLWLMTGQVQPEKGVVRIDGVDLASADSYNLHHAIGLLPEQGTLINGTLLENLTLFDRDREMAAMQVAEELGLTDIAAHLPQGFDAPLGGRIGNVLPRGVVQRIAIARVLTLDPAIILFDDASALLDGASDQLLTDALNRRKNRRSLVVVSHRPSTLNIADRRYELRDGILQELPATGGFVPVGGGAAGVPVSGGAAGAAR